jgi:broad specificity phosphatase PhoE
VLLVRHGRTALNADARLRGHLDPPLDPVGRTQARALASALAARAPVKVVSSPLVRARQTAHAIAHRVGLEVTVDVRLIDRDWDRWAGRREHELLERFGSLDEAPGVEPAAAVAARAIEALEDHAALGACVVLVAHDNVNRLLIARFDPVRGDHVDQRCGCFNVLVRDDRRWRVEAVDQVPPSGIDGQAPETVVAAVPATDDVATNS